MATTRPPPRGRPRPTRRPAGRQPQGDDVVGVRRAARLRYDAMAVMTPSTSGQHARAKEPALAAVPSAIGSVPVHGQRSGREPPDHAFPGQPVAASRKLAGERARVAQAPSRCAGWRPGRPSAGELLRSLRLAPAERRSEWALANESPATARRLGCRAARAGRRCRCFSIRPLAGKPRLSAGSPSIPTRSPQPAISALSVVKPGSGTRQLRRSRTNRQRLGDGRRRFAAVGSVAR